VNQKNNTLWLAKMFQYVYEVVLAADRPIFMAAMVALPFIAPLLPAMITGTNLQKYLFPDHPNWVWIGIMAFELVAMLAQVASVSAHMNLKDDPTNIVLVAECRRADWSYAIYIMTLIASNVFLELANGEKGVNVFVVACLTVGLSFSSSLVNAGRIHKRDEEDKKLEDIRRTQEREDLLRREQVEREDRIRREKDEVKLERWRLKHGYASTTSLVSPEFQNSLETNEKTGRPSVYETPVFRYMSTVYEQTGKVPSFNDVVTNIEGISKGTASKVRNKWIELERQKQLTQSQN